MGIADLDYQWFTAVNQLAGVLPFLNPIMDFLAEKGEYLFYVGVVVYWLIRTPQNRRMVIYALLSACLALGINSIMGVLFYRDRPFVSHHVIQLIQHAANASFPSDHAAGSFVMATSIWLWRKREGKLWLLFAAGISFSRIWTGVHYPSDVIAGMMIGVGSAIAVYRLFQKWGKLDGILVFFLERYESVEHRFWKPKSKGDGY